MKRSPIFVLAWVLLATTARAEGAPDVVLRAMQDELGRSKDALQLPGMERPYYVAYAVVDLEHVHVSAAYGSPTLREHFRRRLLEADVRVGDPAFDSSAAEFDRPDVEWLPIDDDYGALRRALWLATDRAYKTAVEALEQKKAHRAKAAAAPDDARDDFSNEPTHRTVLPAALPALDVDGFARLVERLSRELGTCDGVHYGKVELSGLHVVRRFASADGTVSVEAQPLLRLDLVARTQAEDGMPLADFVSLAARTASGLPDEAEARAAVGRLCDELAALRKAPKVNDYTGPVLFEGYAAAQLLRAALTQNLSGTPPPRYAPEMMRVEGDWVRKLGQQVLPSAFSVLDDPLLREHRGVELVGGYQVDDEGVRARRVALVKRGKLEGLLMSRTPRAELAGSNGHGRGLLGGTRALPANLVVEAPGGLAPQALRKRLLAEAKKAGSPYGMVVRRLEDPEITSVSDFGHLFRRDSGGGSTVLPPLVALRIHPDGREELVRGVRIAPLRARALTRIVAWSKASQAYGFGTTHYDARAAVAMPGPYASLAGVLPTSVVVPDVLFEELELRAVTGTHPAPPPYPPPEPRSAR